MRISKITAPAAAIALGLAGSNADAHIFYFSFGMHGHGVVPPTNSQASAHGLLAYNHHNFTYDLDLRITGVALGDLLDTGPNGTPIQIFNAPRGQNGPIVMDPGFFGDFVQDGNAIRLTLEDVLLGGVQGNISSSVFQNENSLYDGHLYIQLFTRQYPGGEIRGQIPPFGKFLHSTGLDEFAELDGPPTRLPAPAAPALALIAGLAALRRRR